MNTRSLLHEVADYAGDWLDALPERPVGPAHTPAQMRITEALGDGPLPVDEVIADLAREAAPGLTAINSPRFFGYEGTRDQLIQGGGRRVLQRINHFQFHFSLGQTF